MKTFNIISWLLRLVVAITLLQTLYFKFTAHPESVHIFSSLGLEPYGRIGVGVAELITSILILIPATKIYGMLGSLGIILGAVFSHVLVLGLDVGGDGGSLFALAILVLVCSSIFLFMHKIEVLELLNKFKSPKEIKL
jgi:putative oxidoreductase